MTADELRKHSWMYLQLAKSAELQAHHARTERQIDLWNEAATRNLDTAAAMSAEADRLEGCDMEFEFRKLLPAVPAGRG